MRLLCGIIVVWVLRLGAAGTGPQFSCNYDPNQVQEQAMLSLPLEVPLSLPRSSEPRPPTPVHEKYNIREYWGLQPNIDLPGLRPLMVHNDFVMVY